MAWEINEQEFESVLALAAPRRYEYFIKRAASGGELWGLHGEDGWDIAVDDAGNQHIPVWPHPRFAEACAKGPWQDARAQPIDIDKWVEAWIPKILQDNLRLGVFQTPSDQGISVSPERLKHDLEAELSLFNLD